MSEPRSEPEELAELAELPPGDPRLEALEARPRLRAQLRAFREFMAPGDLPEGARVAEAEARLGEVLERERARSAAGSAQAGARGPAAGADPGTGAGPRPGAPRRTGGFLAALLSPRLRPALAAAAVVIVAGGVWLVTSDRDRGDAPVLRGSQPVLSPDGFSAMPSPRRLDDGSLRIEWTPAGEADRYVVVFLSPDLVEIARVEGIIATHLDLVPGSLPAGLVPGRPVLWHVIALRGPDEVARSQAVEISPP